MKEEVLQIHLIAGARPNFMKIGPLFHALDSAPWADPRIIHTGQHYDAQMSDAFFQDFGLPHPHVNLEVGSGSHSEQTARVMVEYEKVCLVDRPHLTIVVGDVNSTIGCALVAKKLMISLGHLEAGLRSGDRTMPEEINRLATDAISDYLWTPSPDADENLLREGHAADTIICVGNIMLDSYEAVRGKIDETPLAKPALTGAPFGVMTLHRPSNVDDSRVLEQLLDQILQVCDSHPLLFPIHPRTRKQLATFGLDDRVESCANLHVVDPMGYIEFMGQVSKASFVLTDSGGLQEETTYLNIPCLTIRDNTERPITISEGTNRLVKPVDILASVRMIDQNEWPVGRRPDKWDGKTARRVVEHIASIRSMLQAPVQ